ncbi:hypothetical protein FSARC_6497 [Fusarium sarcochroum]|uniref:Heterokaryon incompatibility domain-containing protein n=1 Tax=Fusarium sarcochroum TaxID=1208366 RepID=A0A8H4TXB5_9HYPO|nr:hypothetical protein FSARC_6497 [Fusarium sarcochroum]
MSANSRSPYEGEILSKDNSFRLISLEPGYGDDSLAIRLLNTNLDNTQAYEALSYVWGDASNVVPIQILDDNTVPVQVNITVNCHAALKRLRKLDSPRTLWIDAICINQASTSEKTHQLTLMTEIYRKAFQVVVYLGEGTEDTDVALNCIREIDEPSDYGDRNTVDNGTGPVRDKKAALKVLFERPWFHRVWVLQEITFAQKAIILCGGHELDWESLRAFYHWNTSNKWIARLPYSVEYSMSKTSMGGNFIAYGERLLKMLGNTRHCGATDPRDRLYAILPLQEREHTKMRSEVDDHIKRWDFNEEEIREWNIRRQAVEIQVSYDHSVRQVYTDLAIVLLKSIGLDVLRQVVKDPLVQGLPSWVPDWTTVSSYWSVTNKPRNKHFLAGFPETPSTYAWGWRTVNPSLINTWGTSEYTSADGQASMQLHIRAIKIGKIERLGDVCDIAKNYFPVGQWTKIVPSQASLEGFEPPEGSSPEEIQQYTNGPRSLSPFVRTLAMDDIVYPGAAEAAVTYIMEYNGDAIEKSGEERRNWFGNPREEAGKVPLMEVFKMQGSYGRQAEWILKTCDGKRFCVTEDGDIGLAPDRTQVGDVVFAVEGASVPFVFRPLRPSGSSNMALNSSAVQGSEEQLFSLVGEAYSHGIMYGELWEQVKDGEAHVENITVR